VTKDLIPMNFPVGGGMTAVTIPSTLTRSHQLVVGWL